MNREDIIRMAREAGLQAVMASNELALDKFFAVAYAAGVAAERGRCAEICDSVAANAVLGTANECARAIRNQSSTAQDGHKEK